MAFSAIANTSDRKPLGNRFVVTVVVDEVDNTGSSFKVPFLSFIDAIIGAVADEDAVSVQARKNTLTDSATEDDGGEVFLKTSAGTHDVHLTVLGR